MGIVLRQSLINTLIIYLGFLIGGINTLILYERFLKAEYQGLAGFVFSASNIIMPIVAFGIHFTIIKFFSGYKTKEQRDKFLSSVVFLPLLIALPIGFFWDHFHSFIMSSITENNKIVESYTIYIFTIAVSCAYYEVFYAWAKVQMQSVFGNFLKELYNRLAIMILLFLVSFSVITKQEFLYYMAIAHAARCIIMMLYALYLYIPKFYFAFPDNIKEVLKYSFYILLAGSAGAIVLDIDKLMISGKEALNVTAYYSVAVFIGSFIEAPSRAMTQILQPLTAKSLNENNTKEVESLYSKSSINLLLVGGLFFVLINCNVSELFKIMQDRGFADGIWVVMIISITKLVLMLLGNNGAIINNSKFFKIALPIGLFNAFGVYYLNRYFYFDLNFGMEGLAIATFLIMFTASFFKIWFVKHKFNMQPFTFKTFLLIIIIAAFYFVFIPWNFSVGEWYIGKFAIHPIINIILKSILIIPTYLIVVYKLNISEQINNVIKNKLLIRFK